LYRQCGATLLKAEQYQDTVTVCDKLLTTVDSIKADGQGKIYRDETKRNFCVLVIITVIIFINIEQKLSGALWSRHQSALESMLAGYHHPPPPLPL